jgi:anti-sigma factor RsiW
MATDPTPSRPDPDELEGMSERDVLFNAYLEDDLSEEERRDFDQRLEEDEEFRESFESFRDVVGGVRNLPYEFAPPDLASRVRTRVRVRSRGGFFGDPAFRRQRTPYEVVAVVMMLVMVSSYFFMGVPVDRDLRNADEERLELPHTAGETTPRRGDDDSRSTPSDESTRSR